MFHSFDNKLLTISCQILDTNPALYFRLQQQKLIEYIRQGRIAEALEFAQQELAPRGEESQEFLGELEKTMALLAFDSSPSAPPSVTELLSPAQRLKTASEVNAAILESFSQGKEAKLLGLLKLICWGEFMLDERADFPKVSSLSINELFILLCLSSLMFVRERSLIPNQRNSDGNERCAW